MKKYLGLDLGSKTLGLSISTSGIIAGAYDTLYFKDDDYSEAINLLLDVIKKESIDVLVIGLPKHMNNDLGPRGELTLKFSEDLQKQTNAKIVLWDERLTTKQALMSLSSQKQKYKKQRSKKDEVAAVIILQSYLDGGKERWMKIN